MLLVVFRVKISSSLGWRSRGSPDTVQSVMLVVVGSLAGPSALFSLPNLGMLAVAMRMQAHRSLCTPKEFEHSKGV